MEAGVALRAIIAEAHGQKNAMIKIVIEMRVYPRAFMANR